VKGVGGEGGGGMGEGGRGRGWGRGEGVRGRVLSICTSAVGVAGKCSMLFSYSVVQVVGKSWPANKKQR
jgi:hypothetical protein